jgi:hypothetical protein
MTTSFLILGKDREDKMATDGEDCEKNRLGIQVET